MTELREQIARILFSQGIFTDRDDKWEEATKDIQDAYLDDADNLIQSLNLVQLDENQSLPLTYTPGVLKPNGRPLHGARDKSGEEIQQDMWESKFRKVKI